ncbi:N-methyltransferase [Phaffia rhodozyma]|uniref:N-methyltransferase n=1 Tax=Phaffia rhodozyma TaxID=264483 RepID=A0A0F7SXW7_PHARH|nr:N-methyltransferase [Phaffia rhodozyma]
MDSVDLPPHVHHLLDWLKEGGAYLSPSVEVKYDDVYGLFLRSTTPLDSNNKILSVPFDLAISASTGEEAIIGLLGQNKPEAWKKSVRDELGPKEKVISYVILHWIARQLDDESSKINEAWRQQPQLLRHAPYIEALPTATEMTTPLWFTPEEMELLRGTSVFGATADLRCQWEEEWKSVGTLLDLTEADGFTWERYLLASTYISSRSFPSKLLDLTPTTAASYPILVPALDLLNHRSSHPVTWVSNPSSSLSSSSPDAKPIVGTIDFIHHPDLPNPHSQIFNNYGAKPSSSLLLSYGFALPLSSQPEHVETVPLLIAGVVSSKQDLCEDLGLGKTVRKTWNLTVGKNGEAVVEDGLRALLRVLVADGEEEGLIRSRARVDGTKTDVVDVVSGENECMALDTLGAMVQSKLQVLLDVDQSDREGDQTEVDAEKGKKQTGVGNVRKSIRRTCRIYREGQIEILQAAQIWIEQEITRVEDEFGLAEEIDEDEEDEEE